MTKEEIRNLFSYHAPRSDQPARYEAIRAKARELAEVIVSNTPKSADQTAAIRKLRECVMTANAAIALEPETAPVGCPHCPCAYPPNTQTGRCDMCGRPPK